MNKSNEVRKKGKATCYVCGKNGHKAYQCHYRKDMANNNNNAGQKPKP